MDYEVQKKVLVEEIAFRARDLIRSICERNRADILKGYAGADHVHLLVSIPAILAVSKLMQQIKGKSSYLMLLESKQLRRQSILGTAYEGSRLFLLQYR